MGAHPLDPATDAEALIEDFELIDDWDERYRYVIELGRALPAFPEALRGPQTKVEGCASQVWLAPEIGPDADPASGEARLRFHGDSDALIVKGLIAVLMAFYGAKPASEILALDAEAYLQRLGLDGALTPQRSNGLRAMVGRIRKTAETLNR